MARDELPPDVVGAVALEAGLVRMLDDGMTTIPVGVTDGNTEDDKELSSENVGRG